MTTSTDSKHDSPKTLEQYAQDISVEWGLAIKQQLKVAELLAQAAEDLTPAAWRSLVETRTSFGYTTAIRLKALANCQRITLYKDQLSGVDAWSTLDEIRKLEKSAFDEFATLHLAGSGPRPITRELVQSFNPKISKRKKCFEVFLKDGVAPSDFDLRLLHGACKKLSDALPDKLEIKLGDILEQSSNQSESVAESFLEPTNA